MKRTDKMEYFMKLGIRISQIYPLVDAKIISRTRTAKYTHKYLFYLPISRQDLEWGAKELNLHSLSVEARLICKTLMSLEVRVNGHA